MSGKLLTSGPKLFAIERDIHKAPAGSEVIHNFGKLFTNCIDLLTKVSKKSTLQPFPERKLRKPLGDVLTG
jgi:hypothetical protein